VVEYGAAESPTAPAVGRVSTAAEGTPFAGSLPTQGRAPRGSAATAKVAVSTVQDPLAEASGTTAAAEAAMPTIPPAGAATPAVAALGTIAIAGEVGAPPAAVIAATATSATRTRWYVAVVPYVPTIPAAVKPARATDARTVPARKNRSTTASASLTSTREARSLAAVAT
jgi:hypothetical protein